MLTTFLTTLGHVTDLCITVWLRLAQDLPTPLPTLPIFMFVDYVNHRIKLADSVEFTTQYMFPNLALAAGGDDSAPGLGR